MNLQRTCEAKALFERALQLDSKDPVSLIGLSEVLLVLGNYKSGFETARKAFSLSKTKENRIFSWLLIVTSNYFLNLLDKARKETKELLAFLRFEKKFQFNERTFSCAILVQLSKEKLKGKELADLSSLLDMFKAGLD